MSPKKRFQKLLLEIGAVVLSLIYIIPAWMVLVNSFKEKKEANKFGLGLPKEFHFENYLRVFHCSMTGLTISLMV